MIVGIKRWTNILANCALICVVATVLLTGGLYAVEKGSSAQDYVVYYGNVTTASSFTFPEPISSYTFGTWVDENKISGEVTFLNSLWCKPMGKDVSAQIVDTRIKIYDAFKFVNIAPEGVKLTTNTNIDLRNFLSFGSGDRDAIRAAAEELNYLHWNMEDIHPTVNSDCHVTAEVITYTPIFKLPKVVHFSGNHFTYYVDEVTVP